MGTGSAGLIAYLVCIGFVAFVTIIGAGLVLYGRRSDRRKREARRLAAENTGDEGSQNAESGAESSAPL